MQYLTFTARLGALLAVMALCLGVSAARADQSNSPVTGWWVTQEGTGAILIAPCGAQLCGKIEWLKTPLDSAGKPKTDTHNPDASLQSRPLCGLTMLGGFSSDGSGGWTGGWIYDPKSGNTYKSNMHVADDGTLHVRGYIGVPFIGRSDIMTRPATPLQTCAPH